MKKSTENTLAIIAFIITAFFAGFFLKQPAAKFWEGYKEARRESLSEEIGFSADDVEYVKGATDNLYERVGVLEGESWKVQLRLWSLCQAVKNKEAIAEGYEGLYDEWCDAWSSSDK